MRAAIIPVAVSLLFAQTANATAKCTPLASIERSAAKFVGKTVAVQDLACVDVKGGFLCAGLAAGRLIRIESWGLGAKTPDSIASALIGPCKGEAALDKPACRFTAVFEIKDQHDRIPADLRPPNTLTVIAPTVDMFQPKDRTACSMTE